MKILPVAKNIKQKLNKIVKNNSKAIDIKPIKNYSDYIREYGLK